MDHLDRRTRTVFKRASSQLLLGSVAGSMRRRLGRRESCLSSDCAPSRIEIGVIKTVLRLTNLVGVS